MLEKSKGEKFLIMFGRNILRKLKKSTPMKEAETLDYDENGNAMTTEDFPLNKLRQGTNTWFFTKPLSAIVTVTEDGEITVKGAQTEWLYGVEPPKDIDGVKTAIEDRSVKL